MTGDDVDDPRRRAGRPARARGWRRSPWRPRRRLDEALRRARRGRRRRARRAARRAATAPPGGRPCTPAPCGASARRTACGPGRRPADPPTPSRCSGGLDLAVGSADGGAPEGDVLALPSGRRRGRCDARAGRPADGSPGAVWRGRARTPSPTPRSSGSSPASSRSRLVLPAPFGPFSRRISPRSTCRDAPASTGNPPSTATASSSTTTGSCGGRGASSMTGRTRYGVPYLVAALPGINTPRGGSVTCRDRPPGR